MPCQKAVCPSGSWLTVLSLVGKGESSTAQQSELSNWTTLPLGGQEFVGKRLTERRRRQPPHLRREDSTSREQLVSARKKGRLTATLIYALERT